ncbi:NOP5/NOP56 family protein [Salinirubrum litoreum]|uniref:NOP5/NOP56 family protein n=1 Tax=Salinirubrum litoreum TaxID=1126234 RepID=A0ABD5R8E3_9EURY|nr:NOP5/NOP56 family protein [Salinirubrum litoreum]
MTTPWFADLSPDEAASETARSRIRDGSADAPDDWPARAVESGFAESESDYYATLREATISATREAVTERERADDQQLVHAVRAMDDTARTANELAERLAEWAGSLFDDPGTGIAGARAVADIDPADPTEERAVSLAQRVVDLADERDDLESYVRERAPTVYPNLAEMAGPVLATRLVALVGGLESLAKKPSGTIQVLGAEDALFAHLRGHAPSPKHGIIFTHEYVRGTRREDRGSAARAFAGKLAIAARIDHYSGDYRPELHAELRDRIETIQARGADDA